MQPSADVNNTKKSDKNLAMREAYKKPARSHEESQQFKYALLSPSDNDSKARRINAFDSIFGKEVLDGVHFLRKAQIKETRREKHEMLMDHLYKNGMAPLSSMISQNNKNSHPFRD